MAGKRLMSLCAPSTFGQHKKARSPIITPSTAAASIAGKMDIEIPPRKGDERRERDGRIAEAAVRFRQNRRADDRGQGMTRWGTNSLWGQR